MQIYIKTAGGKTEALEVEDNHGIERSAQRLVFDGKIMEDGKTLQDYSVENEVTIHIAAKQRGG